MEKRVAFAGTLCIDKYSSIVYFLWINEQIHPSLLLSQGGREQEEWEYWFENLITSGIKNIRATSTTEAGRRRIAVKKENSNPYQLSREWLTRVAFTWFPNKIQIPISEIESNLREWFNQNIETNRIAKMCVHLGKVERKFNVKSQLSWSSFETMELELHLFLC